MAGLLKESSVAAALKGPGPFCCWASASCCQCGPPSPHLRSSYLCPLSFPGGSQLDIDGVNVPRVIPSTEFESLFSFWGQSPSGSQTAHHPGGIQTFALSTVSQNQVSALTEMLLLCFYRLVKFGETLE